MDENEVYFLCGKRFDLHCVITICHFMIELALEGRSLSVHVCKGMIINIDIENCDKYDPSTDPSYKMLHTRLRSNILSQGSPVDCILCSKVIDNRFTLNLYINKKITL